MEDADKIPREMDTSLGIPARKVTPPPLLKILNEDTELLMSLDSETLQRIVKKNLSDENMKADFAISKQRQHVKELVDDFENFVNKTLKDRNVNKKKISHYVVKTYQALTKNLQQYVENKRNFCAGIDGLKDSEWGRKKWKKMNPYKYQGIMCFIEDLRKKRYKPKIYGQDFGFCERDGTQYGGYYYVISCFLGYGKDRSEDPYYKPWRGYKRTGDAKDDDFDIISIENYNE